MSETFFKKGEKSQLCSKIEIVILKKISVILSTYTTQFKLNLLLKSHLQICEQIQGQDRMNQLVTQIS